jgi:hypothetical protein
MRRFGTIFAATAVACVLSLGGHGSVHAAGLGAYTNTQVVHDVTQTTPEVNACTGAPGSLTVTYHEVSHTTWHDGTGGTSIAINGTFSFVPTDASQPSYTGHYALTLVHEEHFAHDTSTFTLNMRWIGSDGSVLEVHEGGHYTVTSSGVYVSFDSSRCG